MRAKIALGAFTVFVLSCTPESLGQWTAADINDQELIVGTRGDAHTDAVLHRPNGELVTLLGLPGEVYNSAAAISETGIVVGRSGNTAVYWDARLEVHVLGTFYGMPTAPVAINNRGIVVGIAYDSNIGTPTYHGWVRDIATTEFIELPTLPDGLRTSPAAINDQGDIVGSIEASLGSYAVKWAAADHRITILTALPDCAAYPGCVSQASGINSAGVIVGQSGDRPVVWRTPDAPRLLPTGGFPYLKGEVRGINDDGTMVGYVDASQLESVVRGAARWSADEKVDVLASPYTGTRVNNSEASAINNKGVAIGNDTNGALLFR